MQKLVYLFELDSVRKTDAEILIGQQALYNEIVGNGNVVVLTYNQLVDSRGFFSLLDIPEYYDNLVKLFKMGAVRISQYGDVRTISQYLINACSSNRSFIYSGWPLKSTQRRLLALIKRSLMYSDLNEINDYKSGIRTDEEITDLFVEVDENLDKTETKLTVLECKEILENLFHLIKTVLRLSSIHTIYVNPKPDDEYDMSLPKYLHHALKLSPPVNDLLWEKAVAILKSHNDTDRCIIGIDKSVFNFDSITGSLDRSDYHHAIMDHYDRMTKSGAEVDIMTYHYAEAIVDLCYNYQLEYSICNSSKHYNINEFASDDAAVWKTFSEDFFSRLSQDWNPNLRYMFTETNEFDEYQPPASFPDLSRAVRLVTSANMLSTRTEADNIPVQRYEYQIAKQKDSRRKILLKSIRRKVLYAAVCFTIALGVEVAFECLQNLMDAWFNQWINVHSIPCTLLCIAFEVLVILGFTEFLTGKMAKRVPCFLTLSDALREIGSLSREEKEVRKLYKSGCKTYTNSSSDGVECAQPFMEGEHIDFVETPAIKQYLKLRKSSPYLFQKPNVRPYQLAEIPSETNKAERKSLVRCLLKLEEMYGYDFGVTYKSKYNTMIVDPIKTTSTNSEEIKNKPFFPYERVVPSSGKDGVVMIPRCKGKFILIKQFRHAIRAEQYSFPRGYAENGGDPEENAIRELQEELNAHNVRTTKLLGRVASDSGLASTQAYVFYVELGDYSPQIGHEGISELSELTSKELDYWIKAGKITDGFTLSAWLMYKYKYED